MENNQQETVISYLEVARMNWYESRLNADRAGHNSAALNALEARDMAVIDGLLEELHGLGSIALQNT